MEPPASSRLPSSPADSRLRVVIGEDEALLRNGLRMQLDHAGFEVVGLAADAVRLVELTVRLAPDVMITDIRMPPGSTDDGLRAAIRVRHDAPAVAVLLLSHHLTRRYAVELLGDRPEGVGYLLKQRVADIDAFCADVRRIAAGQTVLDAEVVRILVTRASRRPDGLPRLTAQETRVLALMAEGRSNAAIARRLGVTEKVVVHHVSHVYDAFGLPLHPDDHRRVLAVVRFLSREH